MEREPLFITLEGGEGCGKSTQIKLFYKWFSENYGHGIVTREPGGVEISEKIREILKDPKNTGMDILTEFLLFEASRAQFVKEILEPNITQGISVISDRFTDSTSVYQGIVGGISLEIINYLNKLTTNGKNPDLTYILAVDVGEGLRRAGKRGELDRLDLLGIDFHRKVNQGYLDIAKENPERCVVIPEGDIASVQRNMRTEFFRRYLSGI